VLVEAAPLPLEEEEDVLLVGDVDERFDPLPVLPPEPPALPVDAFAVVELSPLPVLAPLLCARFVAVELAFPSAVDCVVVEPLVEDAWSVDTAPLLPPVDVRPVVVVVAVDAAAEPCR
jgi:hypothetical protein